MGHLKLMRCFKRVGEAGQLQVATGWFSWGASVSESTSHLLGWSDASEKYLLLFYLKGKGLVVNVLEAKSGEKGRGVLKFILYTAT